MATKGNLYLKRETLEMLLKGIDKKGMKGIRLTLNIKDEVDQYGNNINTWVEQSKEEIDAKKTPYFTGNGKIFWTNGTIVAAPRKEEKKEEPVSNNPISTKAVKTALETDDLPF